MFFLFYPCQPNVFYKYQNFETTFANAKYYKSYFICLLSLSLCPITPLGDPSALVEVGFRLLDETSLSCDNGILSLYGAHIVRRNARLWYTLELDCTMPMSWRLGFSNPTRRATEPASYDAMPGCGTSSSRIA